MYSQEQIEKKRQEALMRQQQKRSNNLNTSQNSRASSHYVKSSKNENNQTNFNTGEPKSLFNFQNNKNTSVIKHKHSSLR